MIPNRTVLLLAALLVLGACSAPPGGGEGDGSAAGGTRPADASEAEGDSSPDAPEAVAALPPDDLEAVAARIEALVDSGRIAPPGETPSSVDVRADSFYTGRDGRPLWLEDGGAPGLMAALRELPSEGLDVAAADSARLARVESLLETGDAGALARAELTLTEAFLAASTALARGGDDPGAVGLGWRIPRDPPPGVRLLRRVAEGDAPSELLEELRPELPHYRRMVDALTRYRDVASGGGWPAMAGGATVEIGDTAAIVADVRERLVRGTDTAERRLASTGRGARRVFDSALGSAVEHYQRRHGLAVDGVVGPETIEALGVGAAERVEALEANLERLRWLPRDLGERSVLVNVAGFELVALEENRPVLEMDVVVGRLEWRTKIFADTMTYLVFHPYWHVPESIEEAEILPAVRDDRSYLDEQRLDVVGEEDPFGPPVDPSEVDWSLAAADDFPWDFRQRSGPENSLGRIKFIFPNPHSIYLHDTPAGHLFDRDVRAFSHGCIRVERPWELARWVVDHATGRPVSDVERLRDAGERVRIDLDRPVPVYVAYLTVWVDPEGVVSFYPDVYERDDALRSVVEPR